MKKSLSLFFVLGAALFLGLYLRGGKPKVNRDTRFYLKFKEDVFPISQQGFEQSNYFRDFLSLAIDNEDSEVFDTTTNEVKIDLDQHLGKISKEFDAQSIKNFIKMLDRLAKEKAPETLKKKELIQQIWLATRFQTDQLLNSLNSEVLQKIEIEDYYNFFLDKPSLFSKLPGRSFAYSLGKKLFSNDIVNVGKPINTDSRGLLSLIALPNKTFVSGHKDGIINIWNFDGERVKGPINTNSWGLWRLAALPNKTFVSGDDDGTISIWNFDGERVKGPINTDSGGLWWLAALPNKTFVSVHKDGIINIWNFDGERVKGPIKTGSNVFSLAALSNKTFVSGYANGTISIWNFDGKRVKGPIKTGSWKVKSLAVLPNKTFVSGDDDGTISIWTFDGERVKGPIKTGSWEVDSLAVLPNGDFISKNYDGTINIWNSDGKKVKGPMSIQSGRYPLAVLPNGDFATGYENGEINIWNLFPYKGLTLEEKILLKLLILLTKKKKKGLPKSVKESEKFKKTYKSLTKKLPVAADFFDRIVNWEFYELVID